GINAGAVTDTMFEVGGTASISGNLTLGANLLPSLAPSASASTQTITSVDTTGNVGATTSMAFGTDGFAVIAYYDVTNADLKVLKCGNAACSSGNTATTVDSTGDVGRGASIAIGT